jgi:hypothetical protein
MENELNNDKNMFSGRILNGCGVVGRNFYKNLSLSRCRAWLAIASGWHMLAYNKPWAESNVAPTNVRKHQTIQ